MGDRYERLFSVEYKTDKPFDRTIIQEENHGGVGQRQTCLVGSNNEINSELSGGFELF